MQTSVAFLGKILPQRCDCQSVNRRFLGITYLELRHLRPSTSQTFNSLSSLTVTNFRPPPSNAAQEIGWCDAGGNKSDTVEYRSSPELCEWWCERQQDNDAKANAHSQNADTGTLYCYNNIPGRYEFRIRVMGHANEEQNQGRVQAARLRTGKR